MMLLTPEAVTARGVRARVQDLNQLGGGATNTHLVSSTKNGDGRVFPMTTDLRRLLEEQHGEHERLKKTGHIVPHVFIRMVAKEPGGEKEPQPIVSFTKAWRTACAKAGCQGRIPHDFRRTAVRNLVRVGIPERVAMLMTGHKTRSVFERYNVVSSADLAQAANRLNASAQASR